MKDKEFFKSLVKHIDIPTEILKQSEMLKNEYATSLITILFENKEYEIALSYIKNLRIQRLLDINEIVNIIDDLSESGKFSVAYGYAKAFKLKEKIKDLEKGVWNEVTYYYTKSDYISALKILIETDISKEEIENMLSDGLFYSEISEDDLEDLKEFLEEYELKIEIDIFKNVIRELKKYKKYNEIGMLIKVFIDVFEKYLDDKLKEIIKIVNLHMYRKKDYEFVRKMFTHFPFIEEVIDVVEFSKNYMKIGMFPQETLYIVLSSSIKNKEEVINELLEYFLSLEERVERIDIFNLVMVLIERKKDINFEKIDLNVLKKYIIKLIEFEVYSGAYDLFKEFYNQFLNRDPESLSELKEYFEKVKDKIFEYKD